MTPFHGQEQTSIRQSRRSALSSSGDQRAARSVFGATASPPEVLEGYNRVLPGSAERILSMAESEQKHRHALQEQDLRSAVILARHGQFFAFSIGALGIVGGVVLVAMNKDITGFGVFFASLASLVGVYFSRARKKAQKKDS